MASAVPSCFLLSALLLSAPVLAAPAAPQPLAACATKGPATGATAAGDIDYATINQHLTTPDARLRLAGLQDDIYRLGTSRAPEAALVRHRLAYARAQAQAGLGLYADAMATLRQLPLSSPQAPEALLLLAELEVARDKPEAAVRWLRQLAELFPEEPASVGALWRAAELSDGNPSQVFALLRQATQHADQGLASAQRWQAQSRQPGFLDQANSNKLSPELWRLARTTLGSPDFANADAIQTEARRQLHCLTLNREAQLRQLDQHPRLLADLDDTVDTLSAQLKAAREDVIAREKHFVETAQRLKDCEVRAGDCGALKQQRAVQGRELTGWRNRLRTLDGKLAFLRQQEVSLRTSAALNSTSTAVASQLGRRLGSSRGFMQERLQQSLADAVLDWESLSAKAHYKLAIAQELTVDPGLMPAPKDVPIGSPQQAPE